MSNSVSIGLLITDLLCLERSMYCLVGVLFYVEQFRFLTHHGESLDSSESLLYRMTRFGIAITGYL